jgi:hypothetical protein
MLCGRAVGQAASRGPGITLRVRELVTNGRADLSHLAHVFWASRQARRLELSSCQARAATLRRRSVCSCVPAGVCHTRLPKTLGWMCMLRSALQRGIVPGRSERPCRVSQRKTQCREKRTKRFPCAVPQLQPFQRGKPQSRSSTMRGGGQLWKCTCAMRTPSPWSTETQL